MAPALLTSVLLIAACGLVYELIAGTLASYLLGDSVTQFSTVIGTYLAAMGLGSWLSRYILRGLAARFVIIELLVGLVGGFSSAILFAAFAYTTSFRVVLYILVGVVGVLVGLEIPLLMRILRNRFDFKDVVAHVLTFDYLGALGASLLFPLFLVPHLGLVRSAVLFGMINTLVLSTFERTREIGMLRAVGMTRRQVRRMVRHESVITALIGAALGLPIGVALAALMTQALSDQGLVFSVSIRDLAVFTAVAVVAGVVAAIAPARRAGRLNVLAALHYE